MNQIILGECLEKMKNIPNNSIDLVLTDPPYNIKKDTWDNIKNYEEWCLKWILECQRVLKDNGSFYFFHNDMPTISKLMNMMEQKTKFKFKQMIVWNKKFSGASNEEFLQGFNEIKTLRNYQKMVEYCLFYTFQNDTGLFAVYGSTDNFQSIKKYMSDEKKKSGLNTCDQINKFLGINSNGGGQASHFFNAKGKKWTIPTKELYQKLQSTGYFQKSYESLRREYESMRYTFNNQKTHHSVWNYETAKTQGHITPKPVQLIENIIKHSSNEGDLILDPFAGSGTTAIACMNTNRNYICIEKEGKYFELIQKRIKNQSQKLEAFCP